MSEPGGDDRTTIADMDPGIFNADGAMNPNHPLLQRAQNVLKQQLLESRQRIQEDLREKTNAVKLYKQKREDAGVELYGFQQNLATLQLQLEKAVENHQTITHIRQQAEQDLQLMRQHYTNEESYTKQERANHEAFQRELDQQATALKQIESYNEEMKSQIAATRRAAYVAEGAVQQLEKQKMGQDYLIDNQQEALKQMHQQLALYTAQLEAQRRETRAAQETLAEADAEMESVHFEKKQLVAQWRSTVNAVMRREEGLQAVQEALRKQQEQEVAVANEIHGYKKDISREQAANEQLTSVLRKLEGELEWMRRQGEAAAEKAERLQEVASKLQRSLELTEEALKRGGMEAKALHGERESVEKAIVKVAGDVRALEETLLEALGEQTAAERGAQKTAQDVRELRRRIRAEELALTEAQNEMAKLQVDLLNTEAHNERLGEALGLLGEEVGEKEGLVGRYQAELKRRMEEIDKKTREVDQLNKKFERLASSGQDVETGPLEAVVAHLQAEISTKGVESKEMQKRWMSTQTLLVNMQADNNKLAETVGRMKAEQTVVLQKQQRLEAQLVVHGKATRALLAAMAGLQVELQRVNGLIAQNTALKGVLAEDNFNLEVKIVNDLKDMEEQAARLQSQTEAYKAQKRDTLAEIVEVERQIMLWERKIQLEKEMQDMLDPTVGTDVVGAMRKEIHRMELRHSELMKLQEKLMADMEKALSKRELIGMKGRAATSRKEGAGEVTRQQQERAASDLQRSVKDTKRECQATEERLKEMEQQHRHLAGQIEGCSAQCSELREQEEALRRDLAETGDQRYRLLLKTTRQQRMAKRYDEVDGGRYKPQVAQPELLPGELQKAREKQGTILEVIAQLKASRPELIQDLDRVLCHVAE